jgi:hypothetical protein
MLVQRSVWEADDEASDSPLARRAPARAMPPPVPQAVERIARLGATGLSRSLQSGASLTGSPHRSSAELESALQVT